MTQETDPRLADKLWRLEHCYKIVDKQGVKKRMSLNVVQARIQKSKAKRKMILKARQMGVSTYRLIDLFDDTITIPNTTAAILAHKDDGIEKLFRIPRRAYESADPLWRPKLDRGGGSKYEMFFPRINSRIYAGLEVRGDTIHKLHWSEVAFVPDEDKIKATLQAVPLNGDVTLETTPNGMGGYFYDVWNDPDQSYEKFFFPWYIFPEYQIPVDGPLQLTSDEKKLKEKAMKLFQIMITDEQISFRRLKKLELKDLFPQEYPEDDQECFLASGDSVMNLMLLKELLSEVEEPLWFDDTVTIFKEFNNGHIYAAAADTAEGVGGDWSIGKIFDVTDREEVAVLACHRSKPEDFGQMLYDLCARYTNAERPWPLLGVERNNHGHAVLLKLENLDYPNLFFRKKGGDDRDDRPGWVTDKVTRPLMIDTFRDGLEERSFKLNDRKTFSECMTLINNEGKAEAAPGKHDDRVIASAIGVQMVIESSASALYDNIAGKIRVG